MQLISANNITNLHPVAFSIELESQVPQKLNAEHKNVRPFVTIQRFILYQLAARHIDKYLYRIGMRDDG